MRRSYRKRATAAAFVLLGSAGLSSADSVILDPLPTVEGMAGINGETFGYGSISTSSSAGSYSASITSDGTFVVPAPADSPFTLNAYMYQFQGTSASLQQRVNQTSLARGEIRQVDLRRNGGRVTGAVNVTGGALEALQLRASSSNSSVPEFFDGNVTTTTAPYTAVLVMPAIASSTAVYGTATILTNTGCRLSQALPTQNVTVVAGAQTPVQWSIDVSTTSCLTGGLQGTLNVAGLSGQNADAQESGRSMYVSGPQFASLSLSPNQTNYVINNLGVGSYGAYHQLSFRPPYSSVSLYDSNAVQITAGQITSYTKNLSLGTAHGTIATSGAWSLNDVTFAQAYTSFSSGTSSGSPYDTVDLSTGQFDLVLPSGTSYLYYLYFYDSSYDPLTGDTYSWYTYDIKSGDARTSINLTEGGRVEVEPETVETSVARLVFEVAQQPGQPPAVIRQLDISGQGYVRDPVTNAIRASRYVSESDRWQTPSDVFHVSLRGLPGLYQMQARGYGTDGRNYGATFTITFGAPENTPAGTDVSSEFTDASGNAIASLTFDNVLQTGETTVSEVSLGPNALRNFKILRVGGQPQFFDISTTATFDGDVEICLNYADGNLSDPEKEAKMELGHFDDTTGDWELITNEDSPDVVNNIICGTTSSFSLFAILEVDVLDADEDGVDDSADNCPATANVGQSDFDGDGIGDVCDADSDGDSITDDMDLCPNLATADNNDIDGDSVGDPCDSDVDGDTVTNVVDNCPIVSNAAQADFDVDGAGDQCDLDDDGDNFADASDLCSGTAAGSLVDSSGCASPQRFEARCPIGGAYKNHGQYVSCIAKEADEQIALALLTGKQKGVVVSTASQSDVGTH